MKYHTLFVTLEQAEKFEIVICGKLQGALYGLMAFLCIWNRFLQESILYKPE